MNKSSFQKYFETFFFGFRSPDLLFDTRFWTRRFLFVMQSREAGLPFAILARKRELCLQRYVSRMTRTENFYQFCINSSCSSFHVHSMIGLRSFFIVGIYQNIKRYLKQLKINVRNCSNHTLVRKKQFLHLNSQILPKQ